MANDTSRLGSAIGRRVAGLVGDATVATRAKTAKITHDTVMATQDSFFRLVGSEIRDTLGEVFRDLADAEETPPWAKKTFDFLGRGHGQWQAFLAQSVGGQALGVGLGDLFNNYLGPAARALIAKSPNGVLTVADLIQEVVRGKRTLSQNGFDLRSQGVPASHQERLVQLGERPVPPGDVITLLNRGTISTDTARRLLNENTLSPDAIGHTLSLRAMLITPQEAASLENFGVVSRAEGRKIAAHHGMSTADYDKLALGGGQPPGLDLLLQMYRRGIINDSRLQKGIEQGNVRLEWADVIRAARFQPPGVDAPLDAANQNLLPQGEARRLVAEAGVDPKHFDWMLESAGQPLSPEQAATLFNRGVLSRPQVRQMFLESRLKNKYVDLLFPLFERLPPMELTVRLIREGVMTRAEGVRNLRSLGFAEKYAVALVDLGLKERDTSTRELSVTTLRELYEGGVINRAVAIEALEAHGYERPDSEWLLAIGDLRREKRRLDGAVARVRARYVSGRIERREAENALDALQLPSGGRDDYIDTWTIERDVSAPQLTVAQLQAAMKKGIFTPAEVMAYFTSRGYSADDAEVLVALATPTPRPTAT